MSKINNIEPANKDGNLSVGTSAPISEVQSPVVGNKVPIRKNPRGVQLAPIIQPIAFVPYSTQEQPIYTYDNAYPYDDEVMVDDANVPMEEDYYQGPALAAPQVAAKKKGLSIAALFVLLLSIASIAVYVVGYFVETQYLFVVGDASGLDGIIKFFEIISAFKFSIEIIPQIAVIVTAVLTVLSALGAILGITRRGATLFVKITTLLSLIGALVAIIIGLVESGIALGYGLYAIAVISLLSTIIALLAKKD